MSFCWKAKGTATVLYDDGSLSIEKVEYPHGLDFHICGDYMSGEDFYDMVDRGGINSYDGMMGNVYIDNYICNLGLYHNGFSQGDFKVSGKAWLELCKEHNIIVEWCNK